MQVGALCKQLNPELNKEYLINGNNFLTSFYKLSRVHEKILLGMTTTEDIHTPTILKLNTDFEVLPVEDRACSAQSLKSGKVKKNSTKYPDIKVSAVFRCACSLCKPIFLTGRRKQWPREETESPINSHKCR